MELPAGVSTSTYTYAGTGYAPPDAVTSIGNGVSILVARVYMIASTTATTTFPFKFYSIASPNRELIARIQRQSEMTRTVRWRVCPELLLQFFLLGRVVVDGPQHIA